MEKPDLILVDEKDFYYPDLELPPLLAWVYIFITRFLDAVLWFEPDPQKLAVPLLSAYAKDAGFQVAVVRGVSNYFFRRRRFIELLRLKPLAVGISTAAVKKISTVRRVAAIARRHSPGSLIILGGYGAQYSPEMRKAGDITVTGYGEAALVWLLRRLKSGSGITDGVVADRYGSKILPGSIGYSGPEKMLFPDWSAAPARPRHYNIEASRGCRFNCVYCNFPGRKKQVYRPVEDVAAEMAWAVERFRAKEFDFVDSNFTSEPGFASKLSGLLGKSGLKVRWRCFARVADFAHYPGLADEMAEAGCTRIFLGIESINDSILVKMRKGYTFAEVEAGISEIEKSGIPMHANFIVGFPGETAETVRETEKFIKKHRFKSVYLSALMVPEELYERARRTPEEFNNLRGNSPRTWAHDTMDYRTAVKLAGRSALKVNLSKFRPVVFPLGTNVPDPDKDILPPV
ncbi:MAG: radical SAM protein [Elusimicrobiota bacterium]|nr:radical SAM protein [Elusimicrobiota bacterium]